jgi:uncharacterized Zn finger protein
MPRETVREKARRLLAEGRVTVRRASPGTLAASVRGDSAREYRAGLEGGRWYCGCAHAAMTTRCSHVLALQLIFLEEMT